MHIHKLAAMTAALALASGAQAATYNFTFTNTSSTVLASGSLSTLDTLNAVGGYDITSISGTVTGYGAITGLVNNPNQPFVANNGQFNYDNVLFNTAPHFTLNGMLFTTGAATWNIYRNTTDVLTGFDGTNYIPNGLGNDFAGTFSLSPVPEVQTWAMMIVGFAAAGWGMRRRRVTLRFVNA